MSLFERLAAEAVKAQSELHPLAMVVEKELLHHDILREMSGAGLLERLTFMGGTCLRMCYGSNRLSEDLDFTGGSGFTRDCLSDLPDLLTKKLRVKYGLSVVVSEPKRETGNVDTWKMKMVTRPEQKGMSSQRINIDVCAVSSYDRRPMMLHNHYGVEMGTSGLLLQAESREEILSDKFIALALRLGRIKNRDLWDIVWLKQQGVVLPMELLIRKIADYRHNSPSFLSLLATRRKSLQEDNEVRVSFVQEMRRFLPTKMVVEIIENSSFWVYLTDTVAAECDHLSDALTGKRTPPVFKM